MDNMTEREVDNLEQAIQSLKSIDIAMTPSRRASLARLCARETAAARVAWWVRLQGFLAFQMPQRALATALGLVLLLGVSSVLVSRRPASPVPQPGSDPGIQLVSLSPDASGRVTLEWRDGSQRTYRVLKSDNPRDFSRAVSYRVRGNRWTDPNSTGSQVSFYRVE